MISQAFTVDFALPEAGVSEIRLGGRLRLDDGEEVRSRILAGLPEGPGDVRLDLAQVESIDGASAALLLGLRAKIRERGRACDFVAATPDVAALLELYGCPSDFSCIKGTPARTGTLDQIGSATVRTLVSVQETLAFMGTMAVSFTRALRAPRSVNWRSVPLLMERAGADGAPIVLLVNFLVGLIMGLQAALQLERFGAQVFVADLVGLSVTRELGPLMTAIIVAGRSGAAFAAELGTMKVSEEIDAIRTLGLDPQRFLVFPRVLALAAVVPVLTIGSDVMGCLGGLLVGLYSLDLNIETYMNQLQSAVGLSDVLTGLVKSAVFAATITLVSCQRGLATRGGATGVGLSTTSAVVIILFALILLDALFTAVFNFMGV